MRVCWKNILLSAVATAVALPLPAFANYFCQGIIDQVGIDPDGSVILNSSQATLSYVVLRSVSTTASDGVYGVSPDACKGIWATVASPQPEHIRTHPIPTNSFRQAAADSPWQADSELS